MLLRVAVFAVICGVSYGRLTALEGRAVDEDVRNLRSGKDTFCTNPTLKGKVNFSDKLVGRAKLDFEMYMKMSYVEFLRGAITELNVVLFSTFSCK